MKFVKHTEKDIVEVYLLNNKDLLSDLATMKDFKQMLSKRVTAIIKEHPMEITKDMKDSGVIDDEQYKQMLINIRKANAEEDFK